MWSTVLDEEVISFSKARERQIKIRDQSSDSGKIVTFTYCKKDCINGLLQRLHYLRLLLFKFLQDCWNNLWKSEKETKLLIHSSVI